MVCDYTKVIMAVMSGEQMSLPFDRGHLGRRGYKQKAFPVLSEGQDDNSPGLARSVPGSICAIKRGSENPHTSASIRGGGGNNWVLKASHDCAQVLSGTYRSFTSTCSSQSYPRNVHQVQG